MVVAPVDRGVRRVDAVDRDGRPAVAAAVVGRERELLRDATHFELQLTLAHTCQCSLALGVSGREAGAVRPRRSTCDALR